MVHFLWTSICFHQPRTIHNLVASSSFKYLLGGGEVAPPAPWQPGQVKVNRAHLKPAWGACIISS